MSLACSYMGPFTDFCGVTTLSPVTCNFPPSCRYVSTAWSIWSWILDKDQITSCYVLRLPIFERIINFSTYSSRLSSILTWICPYYSHRFWSKYMSSVLFHIRRNSNVEITDNKPEDMDSNNTLFIPEKFMVPLEIFFEKD